MKSNSVKKSKIIDLKKISSMKEKSYLLKYQMKFKFFRKSYILLSKTLITRRKIDKFINQIYENSNNSIKKILEILTISNNSENC